MEYKFEWDEKKNIINIKKHGVSFHEAKMIFFDPGCHMIFDKKNSIFEDRWKATGLSGSIIYNVIFTERNGYIRIISARKSDKREEEAYFYGYSKTDS